MLHDVYPATVDAGGAHYRRARLFQRNGEVRLFVDAGRGGPQLARSGALVAASRERGRRMTMTVETDGDVETWEVVRGSGCGCGSKLKRMTVEEAWP